MCSAAFSAPALCALSYFVLGWISNFHIQVHALNYWVLTKRKKKKSNARIGSKWTTPKATHLSCVAGLSVLISDDKTYTLADFEDRPSISPHFPRNVTSSPLSWLFCCSKLACTPAQQMPPVLPSLLLSQSLFGAYFQSPFLWWTD